MNRITDKQLEEMKGDIETWKKANKEIIMVHLSEDQFDGIFKVPGIDHMKLANTMKDTLDKNKQLCLECVLYPAPEIFMKILEERSGIVVPIAEQLVKAAGVTQEAVVKKL